MEFFASDGLSGEWSPEQLSAKNRIIAMSAKTAAKNRTFQRGVVSSQMSRPKKDPGASADNQPPTAHPREQLEALIVGTLLGPGWRGPLQLSGAAQAVPALLLTGGAVSTVLARTGGAVSTVQALLHRPPGYDLEGGTYTF